MMSEAIDYYYLADLEYANKRLSSTFLKTKDRGLVYVEQVQEDPETRKSHVIYGKRFSVRDKIDMNSLGWGLRSAVVPIKDIDMSPITLGYIFCGRLEKAVFVSRMPMRNLYKQGLHTSGLSFSDGSKEYLNPSELFAPMLNHYPTLKQAFGLVKKGPWSVPFSRAFAVRTDGVLEYMGRQPVGVVKEQNGSVVAALDPKFTFLQQHLDWSTK